MIGAMGSRIGACEDWIGAGEGRIEASEGRVGVGDCRNGARVGRKGERCGDGEGWRGSDTVRLLSACQRKMHGWGTSIIEWTIKGSKGMNKYYGVVRWIAIDI